MRLVALLLNICTVAVPRHQVRQGTLCARCCTNTLPPPKSLTSPPTKRNPYKPLTLKLIGATSVCFYSLESLILDVVFLPFYPAMLAAKRVLIVRDWGTKR